MFHVQANKLQEQMKILGNAEGKRKCKYDQWIFSNISKYPGRDVVL